MPGRGNVSNSDYGAELRKAMSWLAEKPDTLFLGQAVAYPGTAIFGTLGGVPIEKRLELPVAEDMQLGLCTGLALAGFVPISIYPRWNFLLLATNQLVSHLDKLPIYSDGGYRPKVIIRTAVASRTPIDPQSRRWGNCSDAFKLMLRTVELVECVEADMIFPAYKRAYERQDGRSTLIVEHTSRYA